MRKLKIAWAREVHCGGVDSVERTEATASRAETQSRCPGALSPEICGPVDQHRRVALPTTTHTENVERCKNVSIAHGVRCASLVGHRKPRRSAGAWAFGLGRLFKHGEIQVTKTMMALAATTALAGGGIGAAVARRDKPDDQRERPEIQTSNCNDGQGHM